MIGHMEYGRNAGHHAEMNKGEYVEHNLSVAYRTTLELQVIGYGLMYLLIVNPTWNFIRKVRK